MSTNARISRLTCRGALGAALAAVLCVTIPDSLAQGKKPPAKSQTGKGKADKSSGEAKKTPPSLAKSSQVVEAFRKIAESEPTFLSGKITVAAKLEGLVVIKADAELATKELELTPTSGVIVVNNTSAVWYKPVKIKGVPFASISTKPSAGQKSHMYVAADYWGAGGLYENCVFKGVFLNDPAVTPFYSNCLFLAAKLPNCDTFYSYTDRTITKGKYTNCLFLGYKAGNLNQLAELISRTDACGFKNVTFKPPVAMKSKDELLPVSFATDARLYDLDGTIIPAIPELSTCYKGNPKINFSAMKLDKCPLPYYDKLDEINAILDELAAKYIDPNPKEQAEKAAQAAKEKAEKAAKEKAEKEAKEKADKEKTEEKAANAEEKPAEKSE